MPAAAAPAAATAATTTAPAAATAATTASGGVGISGGFWRHARRGSGSERRPRGACDARADHLAALHVAAWAAPANGRRPAPDDRLLVDRHRVVGGEDR